MDSIPSSPSAGATPERRKKYVRAVGPRLRIVLRVVLGLFALLAANSVYLISITILEFITKLTYQNYFYQYMFLAHLALGLLLILPLVFFGAFHIKNAHNRPNRRAVRVGYALFAASLLLLFSGVALMRLGFFEIKNPEVRSLFYWMHIITPLAAVWFYVLHRLAGPRIRWRVGLSWSAAVAGLVGVMVALHSQDPRRWNVVGPKEGMKYFAPSLARTASGNFIPARTLMMDDYCLHCHPDTYKAWYHSAHHFSSFNNPPYLASIRETRAVSMRRDGNVKASRWCAGCHDVVPFFSGAFDNPHYDLVKDPTSQAGITCTACHAITHINSTRGNADYTIEEPIHYPFAFSHNRFLKFINYQLVKAHPEFHKKTFLKPLHKTAEFCSTCHKVSIPRAVSKYKDFLRGQDHYDSYLLSGVSGAGARSFYYPPKAQKNCAACHMPLEPSNDFGARFFNPTNHVLMVHNHLFPGANTGVAHLRGFADAVRAEQAFLKGALRVDIFGVKEGGTIDQPLIAPIRPKVPALKRGAKYLFEIVLRTLKVGHHFTQGTTDSNEIWVDAQASEGGTIIGRSGGLDSRAAVDPWAHFVNVYMLDRNGHRIDRRNAQDIFTPLYNHQIPPGAGQVAHYVLTVPLDQRGPLTLDVKLQYRKFDAAYLRYVMGPRYTNDLPITTIGEDRVTFPIAGESNAPVNPPSDIPEWQRWNDYGIGLLLEGNQGSEKGELVQATQAFSEVEKLGRPDGPLNLARVFFKEGRLDDAAAALQRASHFQPPAPRWTVAWLSGLVNKQNGFLDQAIRDYSSILNDRYPELDKRGFDFSRDYVLLDEYGQTLVERAKQERALPERAQQFLLQAKEQFEKVLALDSENLTAHYNLALIYDQLGDAAKAEEHRRLHAIYRPDDNARDRAIAIARAANPAADHEAESIVLHSLQRPGAPGLEAASPAARRNPLRPASAAVSAANLSGAQAAN